MPEQSEQEKFETWAIVELMGHRKLAGMVSEKIIAGTPLLRIDVPESEGQKAFTTFYGASSIYSLTPVSEDTARRFAAMRVEAPVQPYELKALPVARQEEVEEESDIPY